MDKQLKREREREKIKVDKSYNEIRPIDGNNNKRKNRGKPEELDR